jgi:hypothetical protein
MNPTQPTIKPASRQDDHQDALLKVGLGAVGRLAERWALTEDARARLVNGNPGITTTVYERLEHVSHLLGIYRAAMALFGQRDATLQQWLRAANTALPFAGSSPMEVILDGCNLHEVRGYLECQLVA